ncbi:MAG: hypothetical protein Q9190_004002 [Brigantiaea leucoxantha]
MASKARNGDIILAFSGKWVSWVHTVVAYSAFVGALITGLSLHYHKIVQNEYYVTFMVHRVAGAYTIYSFFEWALILFDVGFDAVTAIDFNNFELMIRDTKDSSRGSQQVADVVLEKEREKPLGKILSPSLSWSEAFDTAAEVYNGVRHPALQSLPCCIAKFAFRTNNPVWPIMHAGNGGWNKLGFALAVLAVFRSRRSSTDNASRSRLLFGMHSLLSDSSTTVLWVWEGFPVRGPIAANGVFTILAMGLGVLISMFIPGAVSSMANFIAIAIGAFMLTTYNNWTGFIGALILAICLMASAGPLIDSAARNGPAAFGFGFLMYNVLVLAHVWVVAYAFVPGGPLMREHTDWVMIVTVLFLGAGIFAAPRMDHSSRLQPRFGSHNQTRYKTYSAYILVVLELLALSTSFLRFPTNNYVPYHKDEKVITAGIWTIHFSLDNDMWSSERRMRDLVKEMEIDVIGFLESDLQRIIMGNRDTTQYIAEDLGMYVDYGPGPNKHTWGSALLSKFPILNSTHHLLPSPVGELAPAIHATLDAYGELVDVVVFHSGQEEDPEDRRLQSEYLAKLMQGSTRPLILLSYLVIKPLEGNYHTYVGEKSGMRDIDASDWDRWCEYILYKGIRRVGYARVSRSTITDTELQVGKFVVGQPEGTDERINESEVPTGLRFPAMFRGQGVRGHRYHVFDEPRYYI